MKKTIALSATVFALFVSTALLTQSAWAGHRMAPEKHVERMTEYLDLTPEQQTEIRAILEARQEQRKTERAAVREQIDAVLTEDQRAKRDTQFDKRNERRVARMSERLDLTPEQETTLRTAMAERRNNPDWSPSQMRQQLSGVLTEEQLAELDEMRGHRGRHLRGRYMK